jgi:hypothetical protein
MKRRNPICSFEKMDVCKGVERAKEKIPSQRMHMKEGVKRSTKMAHQIRK